MKTKKRKKFSRYRGTHTHGRGAKKKARGSGHRGGVGKAGTGKRGDQKKNLILYPFGKDKTLRKKQRTKLKSINLREISERFREKKELELQGYKILSEGELKEKIKLTASAASKSAIDKVKKSGGEIVLISKR
ncbi:uL15 family ribosomal protein [Candidatus Pacearchaeota archaeon]|nr:uL15 family ribosomal protein [Candidatus Pacearchaeota archaeon]